jgi:hypothetical protein
VLRGRDARDVPRKVDEMRAIGPRDGVEAKSILIHNGLVLRHSQGAAERALHDRARTHPTEHALAGGRALIDALVLKDAM